MTTALCLIAGTCLRLAHPASLPAAPPTDSLRAAAAVQARYLADQLGLSEGHRRQVEHLTDEELRALRAASAGGQPLASTAEAAVRAHYQCQLAAILSTTQYYTLLRLDGDAATNGMLPHRLSLRQVNARWQTGGAGLAASVSWWPHH